MRPFFGSPSGRFCALEVVVDRLVVDEKITSRLAERIQAVFLGGRGGEA